MDLSRHDELLQEIADRELTMFLAAPNQDEESLQRPEAFKLMRVMAHNAHGEEFLESYLGDLKRAEKEGRNLVAEKYARMNEAIGPLSESPLLDEIADAEREFLDEAGRLYPQIIKRDNSELFRKYLRYELETLSPQTLELYAREMNKARQEGINPAIERHNWLAAKLGKPLLGKKN